MCYTMISSRNNFAYETVPCAIVFYFSRKCRWICAPYGIAHRTVPCAITVLYIGDFSVIRVVGVVHQLIISCRDGVGVAEHIVGEGICCGIGGNGRKSVGGIVVVGYRCRIGQCRIAVIGAIVRRRKETRGAELLTYRPPPVRFCTGRGIAHSTVPPFYAIV